MDWYYYKKALLPDTEIHNNIEISKKEVNFLLNKNHAWLLRFTNNFDKGKVCLSYYVIKDSWGGLEELSTNTRTQVRKALKMCEVKLINKEVLILQGYEVFYTHTINFKKNNVCSITELQYIESIKNSTDREFFGCFDGQTGKLIAYSQNIIGEGVQYSLAKANPEFYKSHYPFYALFYLMTEHYLIVCNKKYVSDGFRTLDNHSNIQNFLIEKLKFRKAFCNLHVYYKWWLRPIISLLYPFRKHIRLIPLKNLLFQEEISRNSLI